jgi:hypothetical protein
MGTQVRPRLTLEGSKAMLALRGQLSEHAGAALTPSETVVLAGVLIARLPASEVKRDVVAWVQSRRTQESRVNLEMH